eukprot:6476425-Amphidinium_carterae.2
MPQGRAPRTLQMPSCTILRVYKFALMFTTTPPNTDVQTHLCAQETAKRKKYGACLAAFAPDPLRLPFGGVVPAVLDTAGQCSLACQ